MDNQINNIIDNIETINKRRNIIKQIIKQIILKQIIFEVYHISNNLELNKLKEYENDIQNMMVGCFGEKLHSISSGSGFWVIGLLENKLVSALLVELNLGDPWIWYVCRNTDPKYKDYGIGEYMIRYTLAYLKQKYNEYNKIYLLALQKPVSRTKFYQSLGFVLTGQIYYDTPEMVFTQT
ncbi:acetyltransferase GNAT [Fadolivirus algeromassiliense]|jgi:GNAT superfamily N-acetyltransferase|uniref:Acetyltransferase GNAT n=1 Tax=Fadolivirus FV1/VV64 TaxID=3070911 RepID=A0A7D3UTK4_9VIRU|nr:acetyltransferase GNAT [Fadolivirus algeromassiliense]QKF94350.1 acetyltransferase GNAT [Fadolivirus FV1/VV64]